MKTALTIAGSDSGGGAGIQADLKTFTVFGVYGMSVITAVTAQNTQSVSSVQGITPAMVREQLRMVFADFPVHAVKTGMLFTAAIVEAVAAFLGQHRPVPLVVDPVMISTSGSALLAQDAVTALKSRLFPIADLVTPNLHEAEALSGITISNPGLMERAARIIAETGCRGVLIKGGHLEAEARDLLLWNDELIAFTKPRLETTSTHGTGCTLSAAIAAGLAGGSSLPDAVREAKEFVHRAMEHGLHLGAGNGPLNHMAGMPDGN
ncbi:bifunctional hydroxymethylpyrimidine kinase/phosphomethylpyrimidine kinase [bacterium]|nr:bifunctional hydroxymethylpyrimidine kinase/phosphomethylpyrimidine kinase [bacterium]